MIGAAYIRVSTDEQIEFSPDSQLKKIREYAENENIIMPGQFVYMDEGLSGRSAEKRPEFMRMIGDAKKKPKPFDVILVWKFSRFARSRHDSILYKSMLRKNCGIHVISITEQLSDDPTAILIEALLEAMDEYYSINLAQEVRRGMNEKFSRGGVVSVPPFGYCLGEERFQPDLGTGPVVPVMYQLFLDGMSCRQIAKLLNNMDIRTKRGNLFDDRAVEYILKNPVYMGKCRRHMKGPDKNDRFNWGEGITVVDGRHEPIVEEELFQAVQEKFAQNKRSPIKNARKSKAAFMLRGLVRCSSCGSTLTQSVKGKSLQCCKYSRGQCNESHYTSLSEMNQWVLEILKQDFGKEQVEISREEPVIKSLKAERAAKSLKDLEYEKLRRVKAAYEAGIDSLEEYSKRKEEIHETIEKLEFQQKDSYIKGSKHGEIHLPETCYFKINDFIPVLQSTELSEDDKNQILRSFVAKVVFNRKMKTVQVFYYSIL